MVTCSTYVRVAAPTKAPTTKAPTTKAPITQAPTAKAPTKMDTAGTAVVDKSVSECFTATVNGDAANYRGTVSKTTNGLGCLPWNVRNKSAPTSLGSWTGYWTGNSDAAANGVGNHNYCRNPDGETGAWCYTTSSNTRWMLCDVGKPKTSCDAAPCRCEKNGVAFCNFDYGTSGRCVSRQHQTVLAGWRCTVCAHLGACQQCLHLSIGEVW